MYLIIKHEIIIKNLRQFISVSLVNIVRFPMLVNEVKILIVLYADNKQRNILVRDK